MDLAESYIAAALAKKTGSSGSNQTVGMQDKTDPTGEIFNNYQYNVASGNQSHSEGGGTTASGSCSHSEGGGTTASGSCSHSEGGGTTASGSCSHSEGGGTTASGSCSHSEGSGTKAYGINSHVEGTGTQAKSEASHSEGSSTTALGKNSHAEGESNSQAPDAITSETSNDDIVSAWYSAQYKFSLAKGKASHVEGINNLALGDYSHAEGYNTIATSNYQRVQGKNNRKDLEGKFAFIIGNGNSPADRFNAFAIDWEGKIYINNSSVGIDLNSLLARIEALENK